MVYEIRKIRNSKIDKFYKDSMKELDSFFGLNWKHHRPEIILVPNRKAINSLQGHSTKDWNVAWADGTNIYLLDEKNYEKESSHKYSDEEYFALIKHELAHCFSNVISGFAEKPIWFLEGTSIFLSGQNKFKKRPKKLKKFINFYDWEGKEVYYEPGFAVEFLVKKYGKEKLISLLKGIKKAKSKKKFSDLFKSIYGFSLSYKNFKLEE